MMNKLDPRTEARLIALGNKRYYRVLILTVAWMFLVICAFAVFVIATERSFSDFRNYFILVLCALPFCPFSAHKVLFSKSFYATVSYTTNDTQFEELRKAYVSNRFDVENALTVRYKKDDGKEFAVSYKKGSYIMDGLHYDEGDRVFFVRGLKYPMEFPLTEGKEFKCPVCGHTVATDAMLCKRCGLDFSDLLRK